MNTQLRTQGMNIPLVVNVYHTSISHNINTTCGFNTEHHGFLGCYDTPFTTTKSSFKSIFSSLIYTQ